MDREVKKILQDNPNLGLEDIELVLKEMNPDISISFDSVLSLKQSVYVYENIHRINKQSSNSKSVLQDKSDKSFDEFLSVKQLAEAKEKEFRQQTRKKKTTKNKAKKHGWAAPFKHHSWLTPRMSDEERRERNGDKRTQEGYSSTGVKLPSHELLEREHKRKVEYEKEHPKPRRARAKMFISVCMGGQNKRY